MASDKVKLLVVLGIIALIIIVFVCMRYIKGAPWYQEECKTCKPCSDCPPQCEKCGGGGGTGCSCTPCFIDGWEGKIFAGTGGFQFGKGFALSNDQTGVKMLAQLDGNVVIYAKDGQSLNAIGWLGIGGVVKGEFTSTGIFRLFNADGKEILTIKPTSTGGSVFHLLPDGSLAIETASGNVLWSGTFTDITPNP